MIKDKRWGNCKIGALNIIQFKNTMKLSTFVLIFGIFGSISCLINIGHSKESRVFCVVCLRSVTQKKWESLVSWLAHIKSHIWDLRSQQSSWWWHYTSRKLPSTILRGRGPGLILDEFRNLETRKSCNFVYAPLLYLSQSGNRLHTSYPDSSGEVWLLFKSL